MVRRVLIRIALAAVLLAAIWLIRREQKVSPAPAEPPKSLVMLWTSGDPEIFTKVVFPYGLNSRKQAWWDDVELLVWGPSAKLLSTSAMLQDQIQQLEDLGVRLTACRWCADQYSVSEKLSELGIEVKYMGKPLTEYVQSGRHVLVF